MTKNILTKKNCFISGATGGIGKEISKQLAIKNCNLFLTGTNENKLKKLKNDILRINNSININYAYCDVSNLVDIEKLIKKVRKSFKSIDIVINSAGIFEIKSLGKSTVHDFDESFNVNVRAPFLFSKEFSKDMTTKKWGRIVNLGSSSSYAGFKNGTIYSATKHAILGFTRALNAELKEKLCNDLKRSFVLWLLISSESTNIISFFFILPDKAHFKARIFSFLLSENE